MAAMFGNPTVVQSIQMIQAMLTKGVDYSDFEDCDEGLTEDACEMDTNTGDDVTVRKQSEIGTTDVSSEIRKPTAKASVDIGILTAESSEAKASTIEANAQAATTEMEESAASSSDSVKASVKIPSLMDAFNQHGKQFSSKSIGVLDLADITRVLSHLQKCLVQKQSTRKVEKQTTDEVSELKKEALQSVTGSNIIDDAGDKPVVEKSAAVDATVEDRAVDKRAVLDSDITQASETDEKHLADQGILGPRPLMSLSLSHSRSLPRQKHLFIVNPVLASHFEIQLHQQMHKPVGVGFSFAGIVSRPFRSLCPSFNSGSAGLMPSPIIRPPGPSYPKRQNMFGQLTGGIRSVDTETPRSKKADKTESNVSEIGPAKKNVPSLLTLGVPVSGADKQKCVQSLTAMSGHIRLKNKVSNIRPLFGALPTGATKTNVPLSFSWNGDKDNSDSRTGWPAVHKKNVPSLFGLAGDNEGGGEGMESRSFKRGLAQGNTSMGAVPSIKPLLSKEVIPGHGTSVQNILGFGPQQFSSKTAYGSSQQSGSNTAFPSRTSLRGKNLIRGGGANLASVYSKPNVGAADWASSNETYENTLPIGYGNSGIQSTVSNNGKWDESVTSCYKQKEPLSAQPVSFNCIFRKLLQ